MTLADDTISCCQDKDKKPDWGADHLKHKSETEEAAEEEEEEEEEE